MDLELQCVIDRLKFFLRDSIGEYRANDVGGASVHMEVHLYGPKRQNSERV